MIHFIKRRLVNTFLYSMAGIKAAWKMEEAFRIESFLAPVFIAIALLLSVTNIEKILLVGSVMVVLITELLNTGLEKTIDRLSMDEHHLSKIVKDIGSAAVLFSLMNLVFTWFLIVVVPFFTK